MTRVSVALCTFQGGAYIDEQLGSIAAQSRTVDEVVVSDDGSTDETLARVHRWADRLPQLRVLSAHPRLGVTRNFERAITATTGDIVILSDQDDVWHRDRVARSLELFDGDPAALLTHSDADLIGAGADGQTLLARLGVGAAVRRDLIVGRALDHLLRRNLVTGATVAFRRELLDVALPFPESWLHDEWLAVIASLREGTRLIDASLIDYRQHADNEVGVDRRDAAHHVARLTQGRQERNARLLARAQELAARAHTDARRAAMLEEKVRHERVRSALPARRLGRVAPVTREAATGRYRLFGNGLRDIVRDLVQPAR